MCTPAVFAWGVFSSSRECLGVTPLANLLAPYGCDIVEYKAQTARGNLYGFEAEVSCVPYVVFEEFNEFQNATVRAFNTSEPIQGTFWVPTLGSETGGNGGYGPGELKNQTLWLDETVCLTQAEDELVQGLHLNTSVDPLFLHDDPSEEYCPGFEAVGGSEQPLECCIGEIDVVLDWGKKQAAWVAAAFAGILLGLCLICRCLIQCCISKCCCIKKCRSKCRGTEEGQTKLCSAKNVVTTLFRCGAVALSLAGYGFNALLRRATSPPGRLSWASCLKPL